MGFGIISGAQAAPADTIAGSAPPPPPVVNPPVQAPVQPQAPSPPPPPVYPQQVRTASSTTIVSTPSMDQASAFDQKFKGTPLEGKWDAVRSAAEKHGISPALAAAVMGQETGFGKNVRGNNPGGLMDPQTNWQKKQTFSSIDQGIDATARVIARNYQAAGGSLDALAQRYAPVGAANDKYGQNKDWLPGVKKNIAFFGSPDF